MNPRTACLVAASLLLLSCISGRTTKEERRFLDLSVSARRAAINDYPADQRVGLYVVAMVRVHPADLELADAVAMGGASVVPYIADALRSERHDAAKTFLIFALRRMQDLSYYSVSSDRSLMALVKERLDTIKSPEWRRLATEFADGISRQHSAGSQL